MTNIIQGESILKQSSDIFKSLKRDIRMADLNDDNKANLEVLEDVFLKFKEELENAR